MKKVLFSLFFFFNYFVSAQVTYVDIPDTTLVPVGGGLNYIMDMNSDGIPDFVINLAGDLQLGYIQFKSNPGSLNNKAVEAGLGEAKKMQCQDSVNANTSQWNSLNSSLPIITYLQGNSFGSQYNGGVVDGYLGIMFWDSLSTAYYGWIRVDVPETLMQITIKDFAYSLNPNGIKVCDIGDPCFNVNLVLSMTSIGETLLGANDGSASVSVSGGVPPYTYFWSNSMTTASISSLVPGYYSVVVTDSAGCSNSDSVYVDYGQVEIEDLKSNKISVYPNPFNEQLLIKSDSPLPRDISIYNIRGGILLRTNSNTINTSDFVSGLYVLRVKMDNEIFYYKLYKH